MHILLLSLEYSPGLSGGVGTHVQELSNGLVAGGETVSVLAGTVGKHQRISEGRKDIHLVPPERPTSTSIAQGILEYNRVLARYAKEAMLGGDQRPDLVHCHNWITFPAAREIAVYIGVPLLTTVHYLSHPIESWWGQIPDPAIMDQETQMLGIGQTFIAVSEAIKSLMTEVHGVPGGRIKVIYNGIDPELLNIDHDLDAHREKLKKIAAPEGQKIVLYTGRLHPMKGVSSLLQSADIVLQEAPTVRYLLAGDPDSQAFALDFRAQIAARQRLKAGVTVLGKINRNQVAALYSVADLAILPSVFDPCPYAAIEAMFAGVPLVASDGGGLGELYVDQVSGIAVPVRANGNLRSVDPRELADATLRVLRDPSLAERLGNNARTQAFRAYTSEGMVEKTREVYAEILAH